jgi:hypothetical protein
MYYWKFALLEVHVKECKHKLHTNEGTTETVQ